MREKTFKDYKDEFKDETVYIFGKGPTNYNYENVSFIREPIFFINESVELAKEYRPDEKERSFLFVQDMKASQIIENNNHYVCMLPRFKGDGLSNEKIKEDFIDKNGECIKDYCMFYNTGSKKGMSKFWSRRNCIYSLNGREDLENRVGKMKAIFWGRKNGLKIEEFSGECLEKGEVFWKETSGEQTQDYYVTEDDKDIAMEREWLYTFRATIHSAICFAWYTGANKIKMVGCDGKTKKDLGTNLKRKLYDKRLEKYITTKSNNVNLMIKLSSEVLMENLGMEYEYEN
jgi:hypothetical protein